jgi:hypothetical protein
MKRSRYNIRYIGMLVLAFSCSITHALSYSNPDKPGKEFTKSIVKEFDISRDGTVGITNKYGSIDIRTWDASQVKIDVTLMADARNQEAANEIFNRIAVKFENSPSVVRAITEIETTTGWKSWFNWGSGGDEFEINYVVHLPSTVVLELDNKYGDIYVADMNNRASVVLKYGDMKIGNINGNATITMGYSDGSVSSTNDLNLHLAYSELYLGKANNISFDGKYSDLEIETAGDMNANTGYVDVKIQKVGRLMNTGKYDDFVISSAVSMDVDSRYSGFVVSDLETYGDFTMSYGSVDIQNVNAGFQSISIQSSYTDVSIDVAEDAAFTLDASTRYCDIHHYGMEIFQEIEKQSEATVKGYRGSRDAAAKITAMMSYGELTIR